MPKRKGYILLTVLLLLMIAAVAMASMCRLAVERSVAASVASDELQRRWGTLSCRHAVLSNAENVLELQESSSAPLVHLHADFSLGTEQFSVDVCDEQAKVNVNTLYVLRGKDQAEQSLLDLARANGGDLKPRLRPTAIRDLRSKAVQTVSPPGDDTTDLPAVESVAPIFGSWSEVFPDAQPAQLFPNEPGNVTGDITCWGNGSLNLRRASLASITQLCSPTLSPQQIAQIFVLRNRLGDTASVDQLLAAAHIGTTESFAISPRLSLASAAHSLWIRTQDHSAIQRSLFILDASDSDNVRQFSFQW